MSYYPDAGKMDSSTLIRPSDRGIFIFWNLKGKYECRSWSEVSAREDH